MLYYDLLDISRVCAAIMTATFKKGPSVLEIWFFTEFKMRQDYTSSTQDGKVLSSSPKLQGRVLTN
jgi:hypothetical protein